ncbi:TauD/TfdA family dioxygenase [Streptomyces sp. CNQ085]|uniref:TauD/TfdA family dioxygenase n=1 Tax=Streptomyces sp. CNQ085 TaxID=2886944 RepID=UPI001F5111C3|nr:TauD/TfdA family dioxygenase [Streptomyces sp. CNQ085]MCI0384605.1 TauD/TfdA family dioxygenase [Streptomyces sp. CNQ085]
MTDRIPTRQPAPAQEPGSRSPGLLPSRVGIEHADRARELLAEHGAVVLTGSRATADALVMAAALMLGGRLRELFPHRLRTSGDSSGPVHLHADSFDLQVDTGGVRHRRRDPDEDYVLVQCLRSAPAGGDSFAVDAYRFVDGLQAADPSLWEFLTGADVDLYGAWAGLRGLPSTPRVGRHVEYTRTGRRIVRRTDGAAPLHRDPDTDHVRAMLNRFEDAVHALESALPRFRLDEGDILVLDNYRCWHGRDAHEGDRSVRILTLRSADAR